MFSTFWCTHSIGGIIGCGYNVWFWEKTSTTSQKFCRGAVKKFSLVVTIFYEFATFRSFQKIASNPALSQHVVVRISIMEMNSSALQVAISWIRCENKVGALCSVPNACVQTIVHGVNVVKIVIQVSSVEVAVLTDCPFLIPMLFECNRNGWIGSTFNLAMIMKISQQKYNQEKKSDRCHLTAEKFSGQLIFFLPSPSDFIVKFFSKMR